jgi:hypothetical protein
MKLSPEERMSEKQFVERAMTLTDADLEALRDVLQCSKCAFSHDESDTLRSLARNMNRASSLATKTIVTGLVMSVLTLTWFSLKHIVLEFIKNGGVIK